MHEDQPSVDYNHAGNLHTLAAPLAVLPVLFGRGYPTCLLDVGCGLGTWLKSALDLGIADVVGIDGVDVRQKGLLVADYHFRLQNLTQPWDLARRFEAALCLEVAEHLPASAAAGLVDNLVRHSDLIAFSAACPNQVGDHHVNCQWPAYWQELFNARGFRCSDDVRWQIWGDARVEPWYRQNLFVAVRDENGAGKEDRLAPVLHPDMVPYWWTHASAELFSKHTDEIEHGRLPLAWYLKASFRAAAAKLLRKVRLRSAPNSRRAKTT